LTIANALYEIGLKLYWMLAAAFDREHRAFDKRCSGVCLPFGYDIDFKADGPGR